VRDGIVHGVPAPQKHLDVTAGLAKPIVPARHDAQPPGLVLDKKQKPQSEDTTQMFHPGEAGKTFKM